MDAEALGEVLGEVLGIDTMGDDTEGMSTVGLRRALARRSMGIMKKPSWRKGQLAPGVQAPREGLEPLPLVPDTNNGVFNATNPNITWRARPQRPFRAERLIATVLRSGATAAAVSAVTTGIFIGTQLQQLQIGSYSFDFFSPNAFGVRLDLQPAEPGIDIAIGGTVSPAGILSGTDFIAVQLIFLGRSIAA